MMNGPEVKVCPVCGRSIVGNEHSRMGSCESTEGTVEYWACFPARDVFQVKPADTEN